MQYQDRLDGKDIYLRSCVISDCTEEYLSWLNDPQVNQYLETRWNKQSLESITEFVDSILKNQMDYLFAIITNDAQEKHIGNIKIGPIHPRHSYADISYFLGDRTYWGKGLATQAIGLVTRFGFDVLGLYRIQAGVYENNIGSIRALQKSHFILEATLRKQLLDANGERQDHLFFGKLRDDKDGSS